MKRFDESQFRAQVDKALEKVRTILDNTRNPQLPSDVPHLYEDKYLLAEFLTNITITAQLTTLETMGLTEAQLNQLKEWSKTRSVSLRFQVSPDR